jgi:chemotaxis protein MotA
MDILSLIGIVLGVVAIVGGAVAKGAGLSSLWSAAAFIIVILGTLAAILVQTPMPTFRRALGIFGWIIKPPEDHGRQLLNQINGWSARARKDGLLGLEADIGKLTDPFLRKGLQMLVDGNEPDTLRKVLEIDLHSQEQSDLAAAKVFEGMGIYAPTLGIIGAVLGLMAVMQNLADPSKLGVGIAAAFTATIYGIASANLFFLPVAAKLKSVIRQRARTHELVIEGLIAIAEGENPRNIESRLQGYLL